MSVHDRSSERTGRSGPVPGGPCPAVQAARCVELLRRARRAFGEGRTLPQSFRLAQIQGVLHMLQERELDFMDALAKDLHQPPLESVLCELSPARSEALHAIANLGVWVQPRPAGRALSTVLDERVVVHEPLGVVLIRGAWCSPVHMCLGPLVGAIAAGNCAVVSPSGWAAHTARLLLRLLPLYLDTECFHVFVEGERDRSEVLELKFDHIFYAGNRAEAGRVSEAAARSLTPVTLIVGGRNPCYVDRQCDITATARRLVWARFHNAGQSLVAPGYVLCHAAVKDQLVDAIKAALVQFYGADPRQSQSYGRMINLEVFHHVRELLWRSGKVATGGHVLESERYIAPTVLTEVRASDPIMHQEVLGPILPIVSVCDVDEAVVLIRKQEKALCVYVCSTDSQVISRLMSETSSGTFCSNDCVLQSLMVTLPLGGVGASGTGWFHGRCSFDAFSHRKWCLLRSARLECVTRLRYPPYEDATASLTAWASALSVRSPEWCSIL